MESLAFLYLLRATSFLKNSRIRNILFFAIEISMSNLPQTVNYSIWGIGGEIGWLLRLIVLVLKIIF
ncbi:hypothetical protein AY599_03500 [Leptolyngbya valderiana BDU 20041]|nr:hypothetical protein AY599_03500 [Leptolyngbya valderiana BDU 20041]